MLIHYFNIQSVIPNRDLVYLKNLSKTGHSITYFHDNSVGIKKFLKIFKKYKKEVSDPSIVWVGYTAYILVPFVKIMSRCYLVFNASNSLYDGMINSRAVGSRFSFVAIKYWLIDFFAFLFSDLILVETEKQKEYLAKNFFVSRTKITRAWTGADDDFFFKDNSIKKEDVFTVVFRGGFLPESGVDCAAEAAVLLKDENIKFRIIGRGILEKNVVGIIKENDLTKVELHIGIHFTEDKLRSMMQSCHLCLGQLSNHPKLLRTIPYKAFESLAMGMPYLTARKEGILELLQENITCLCFEAGNPKDLADKIMEAKNSPDLLQRVAENGHHLYQKKLSSGIITQEILKEITSRLERKN